MIRGRKGAGGAAAIAAMLALALMPSAGQSATQTSKKRVSTKASVALTVPFGSFTPAAADPRAAASFARAGIGGLDAAGFRFTPATAPGSRRAVTVAVRARRTDLAQVQAQHDVVATTPVVTAITPTAYNLGVSVGWKRFAITGDVARVDTGMMPGSRESADVALSYGGKNWSTRVVLGAERGFGTGASLVGADEGYSVDLGGSYSLTRNLAVTGGMRYRVQRDQATVAPLADLRRDSQAVYLGTAFRF
ncbi:hypothetical protein [Sphingomonas quercus]|uniref:Porin n=1 Tax=Sphingomonas quercus TaxID=2842451 RepID=A0ABS6BH74_9SPHN|nr:hypothetical protein [Sphingomonas quercus]MBU3076942.1 hypothetical protein [Sphingomonas quercus]